MTRLIRRALLATAAAIAGLALHGQPTTAGLLDLDEFDDLTAAVLDSSTTQPSTDQTPIATLLDRTSSIAIEALDDLGAVVTKLDLPVAAPPALPATPPPGALVPDAPPAPELPVLDPDVGGPPSIADPAVPGPGAGVPPEIGDGSAPLIGGPASLVDPAPAQNPRPPVAAPTGPRISGPADVGVVATGDAARRPPTGVGARAPAIGTRPPADSVFDSVFDSEFDSVSDTAPTARNLASPDADSTTSDLGRTFPTSPGSRSLAPSDGPLLVETSEGRDATSRAGGGGLSGPALGISLAAVAASSIMIAAVRRAISRRGQRADAAVDREREPTGRASAQARPPRRVPPVRTSADDRAGRRAPPGRASADARPVRRAPRSGGGGHPVDGVGRDRRVPRTPSARSTRTDTQRASGTRRQLRGQLDRRAPVTLPPARRTTTPG